MRYIFLGYITCIVCYFKIRLIIAPSVFRPPWFATRDTSAAFLQATLAPFAAGSSNDATSSRATWRSAPTSPPSLTLPWSWEAAAVVTSVTWVTWATWVTWVTWVTWAATATWCQVEDLQRRQHRSASLAFLRFLFRRHSLLRFKGERHRQLGRQQQWRPSLSNFGFFT